jgi:hypothetical protein
VQVVLEGAVDPFQDDEVAAQLLVPARVEHPDDVGVVEFLQRTGLALQEDVDDLAVLAPAQQLDGHRVAGGAEDVDGLATRSGVTRLLGLPSSDSRRRSAASQRGVSSRRVPLRGYSVGDVVGHALG